MSLWGVTMAQLRLVDSVYLLVGAINGVCEMSSLRGSRRGQLLTNHITRGGLYSRFP